MPTITLKGMTREWVVELPTSRYFSDLRWEAVAGGMSLAEYIVVVQPFERCACAEKFFNDKAKRLRSTNDAPTGDDDYALWSMHHRDIANQIEMSYKASAAWAAWYADQ